MIACYSLEELKSTLSRPKCLVIFSSSWTCEVKSTNRLISALTANHPKITIAMVDIDSVPEALARYDVWAIPTFELFHDGTLLKKVEGCPEAEIAEAVRELDELASTREELSIKSD